MEELNRACALCNKMKPASSFDRESDICTSCYNFIRKASKIGLLRIQISRHAP